MSDFIKEAIAEREKIITRIERDKNSIKLIDGLLEGLGEQIVRKAYGSKKEAVHILAKDCIATNGGHANAAAIFDYVIADGVKISRNVLKNYLYKFDDIKSAGRKGFAVKHR